MPLKLPRLQSNMPIADAAGKALTAFSRLWDLFARLIEDNEASQAEIIAQLQIVQQTQQDEIDRLNRVLAGTENFTGIQVGGQNVKPFLDKTDGDELVDPSGLADALVSTPKIATTAVTNSSVFSSPGGPYVTNVGFEQAFLANVDVESDDSSIIVILFASFNYSDTSTQNVRMNIDSTDYLLNVITPNNVFTGMNMSGASPFSVYAAYTAVGLATGLSAGTHEVRVFANSDSFEAASYGPMSMIVLETKR